MLTKTNKLTALIIAIMVMMNLVIATVPAMVSATFKQAVFEDFEDETTAFFLDGATNSQNYVTFSR